MDQPLASCLMLTYGRARFSAQPSAVRLLEESVESFLRQDYPNTELVIINDTANQPIVFQHDRVRIVNCLHRFKTLGQKRNFAAMMARGEILLTWDDDDICLPCRVSQSVAAMQEHQADYVAQRNYWYSERNRIVGYIRPQRGHLASACFTRKAFQRVKYREMDTGEDLNFYQDVVAAGLKAVAYLPSRPELVPYIYRWAYLADHVSGRNAKHGYQQIGRIQLPDRTLEIQPGWDRDYVKDVAAAADTLPAVASDYPPADKPA